MLVVLNAFSCPSTKAGPVSRDGGKATAEEDWSNGMHLKYSDAFKDFYRGDTLILRQRHRVRQTFASDSKEKILEPYTSDELLVPIDGKVVAIISIGDEPMSFNITTPAAMHFSSGRKDMKGTRYVYLCIPSKDYCEYFEVKGTTVTFPLTDKLYEDLKPSLRKMADDGYIHQFPDKLPLTPVK